MGSIFTFCPVNRIQKLVDKQDQAIIDCKICLNKIISYTKRLEQQASTKQSQAKAELKGNNRDKAKRLLSQSKLFIEQTKVANGQLEMIQDEIMQINLSGEMKKDALVVLEQGNEVLKKLNEEVNVEKFDKVTDDMIEIIEQQHEISEFLFNGLKLDRNGARQVIKDWLFDRHNIEIKFLAKIYV